MAYLPIPALSRTRGLQSELKCSLAQNGLFWKCLNFMS